MKMILMGTGTSHGVPVIACDCAVCTSTDSKNKRLRSSAYVTNKVNENDYVSIVIDVGPEFRIQALRSKIKKLDAILLTHAHADHLHGLDDIHVFSHTVSASGNETAGNGLPVYASSETLDVVKLHFDYIFKQTQKGGGKPKIILNDIDNLQKPFEIENISVLPIPMKHGELDTTGYLLSCFENGQKHSIAYLTDCNFISDESISLIQKNCGVLDHLVIDALRIKTHSTHCSFHDALCYAERLGAFHTWFTHMTHDSSHDDIQKYINDSLSEFPKLSKIVELGGNVSPGYDGLELN